MPANGGVRIFLREIGEVVGEDEADADDEVHPFGGEQVSGRLRDRLLRRAR